MGWRLPFTLTIPHMKLFFKPLHEQTIVITGASSGIGLATARAAAAQGANVVLASRNASALEAITSEINASRSGSAVYVMGDVARRDDLQRVADTALSRFGGFDTWVNNAGVTIYGRLEEVSDADFERLFQTNFWGVVRGSLIAVKHLKKRGGALINIGSVLSDSSIALQGMYSASKHAVKGFTNALRMELEAESAPVSVTLIKPGAIDTPYTRHAKNYMREEPKHVPPVYAPEEVSRAILYAATHAKRDIYVGSSAKAMSVINRFAPRVMDRIGGSPMIKQQKREEPARNPEGSLYQAGFGGEERGDQPGHVMERSFYTRSSLHPLLTGAVLATAGVAAGVVIQAKRRRHESTDDERAPNQPRSRQLTGVE